MNGEELDIHAVLADDAFGEPPASRAWQPSAWWAWHIALVAVGAGALLVGGVLLSGAELGTSLRVRGCDASPLPGFALLAVGALVLSIGMKLARLQYPGAVLGWDWRIAPLALPVPLLLLAGTIPGLLGCALAQDIANVGAIGEALVGAPGLVLAGSSAALVGVAAGAVAHVTWQAPPSGQLDDTPGIVELAIQEAEALEADRAAQRFHGVDPID